MSFPERRMPRFPRSRPLLQGGVVAATALSSAVAACGELGQEKGNETIARGEVKADKFASGADVASSRSDIFDSSGNVKLPVGVKIPSVPAVACAKPRTNRQLVARVYQDVVNRVPTDEELKNVDDANFNYSSWLDGFLASSRMDDGYSKFMKNLLRLDQIVATDDDDVAEAQLVNDLRAEPVELVKRNKDKPWPWFWQTKSFYCTERTATLYGLTRLDAPNFVECTLPPERAGLLGLVSVLRASSPAANPQAFYRANNNYGRVKNYVYWTKGLKLQAATNGPVGTGAILPLQACVPTTDMRIKKNADGSAGLIFGTAAVPLSGSACSGCHSRYNAPLSIAFRRFEVDGTLLDFASIDALGGDKREGFSKELLKSLLAEQNSCWSPDPDAPPQPFVGLVGLADITARSKTFGEALGVQVPKELSNVTADANMSASIAKTYYEEGQTLKAAFKGFFLSDSYRCEVKK